MTTLTEAQISKLLKEREENSALPFLLFSDQGDLVCANDRARKLLKFADKKFPIKKDDVLAEWIFFNEEMSGQAIFSHLLKGTKEKVLAQLGLKTCRVWSLRGMVPGHVLILCELMRKGDLMQD